MNKKTIVINITWQYLSNIFIKNKNEVLEIKLDKIAQKKGISKN